MRRVLGELGVGSKQYGFLWCDEFGGWNPKKKIYNTNLHAHGVYVGPYVPQKLLAELWTDIRAKKDGAKTVWIEKQRIDNPPPILSNASAVVLFGLSVTTVRQENA